MRTEHADRGGCLMEAAFRDAAYTRYFYPEFDDFSIQAMTWFYTKMIQYAMQSGRAWGAYEGNVLKGVALWQPPYESGVSMWGMIKTGMAAAPWNLGVKAAWRVLSILDQAEKKHKQTISTPHWALYSVGVDPDVQGRGIGTQLLQPILDTADQDGLPCYLDTPSMRSLPFFQRLGFEVVFNVSNPSSGPQFWTMLRRPQRLRR